MVQDKDFFSIWSARLQSVLRIVVAGLFLTHGTAKLLHVPHIPSFDNVELMSLVGIAGLLELVGGFLLLIAPPWRHRAIREALGRPRELPFKIARHGSRLIFVHV